MVLLLSLLASGAVGVLSDAGKARAGTVYRCDDGSGVPVYQNLPCAPSAQGVELRVYADAPDGAGADAGGAGRDRRLTRDAPEAAPRSRAAEAPARGRGKAGTPPAPAVAFECRSGGQRWLQLLPCAAGSGRTAITSAPLDRAALCARLRDAPVRAGPGGRSSDDTYERNRLRARGNC